MKGKDECVVNDQLELVRDLREPVNYVSSYCEEESLSP